MPDAFDMLGDPVTTDKGTIYDYPASTGEAFLAGVERAIDTNPLALGARALRTFSEDFGARFGGNDDALVSQEEAQKEIAGRGLDLKVPVGGITRYELDTLQYLKQREVRQNTVGARADGVTGAAAGFAGAFAGSFADPVNVASNFIPFVSQYRYARWLEQAGTSTFGRAAVRAKAGAIEGAAGAAVIEPLVYAGATSLQLDYDSTDSFLNVTLGGIMGGGLHTIGGAVYDARVSKAMRGLDRGIAGNAAIRDAIAAFPEMQKRELFQASVVAMERGEQVDVAPQVLRHAEDARAPVGSEGDLSPMGLRVFHGSGRQFDEFKLSSGPDANQAFGHGLYFTDNENIAESYKRQGARQSGTGTMYEANIKASPDEMILWDRPLSEQPAVVQDFVRKNLAGKALQEDTGRGIYYAVSGGGKQSSWPKASTALRKAGIKGVRYEAPRLPSDPDRAASNFVVFDAKDVEIVTRNGEPIAKPQSTPRGLSSLMQDAKALRTEAAFNRQFVDDAEATIAQEKARPKDKVAAVQEDEAEFRDIVEEYRGAGLTTADDDARLKQADDLAAWADRRAKAFEAAAGCMETT